MVPGRVERPTAPLALEVYQELAELSDRITLTVYELEDEAEMAQRRDVIEAPGLVLRGELNRPLRYYGAPTGHLFVALIRAMVLASTRAAKPSAQIQRLLRKLRQKTRLRVLGSPLDPNAGQAALIAYSAALLSPKLQADVFTIEEFPEIARRSGVQAAPTTFVGDQMGFAGVVEPLELCEYIALAQRNPSRARLNPPQPRPDTVSAWRPAPADPAGRAQRPARAGPDCGGSGPRSRRGRDAGGDAPHQQWSDRAGSLGPVPHSHRQSASSVIPRALPVIPACTGTTGGGGNDGEGAGAYVGKRAGLN